VSVTQDSPRKKTDLFEMAQAIHSSAEYTLGHRELINKLKLEK